MPKINEGRRIGVPAFLVGVPGRSTRVSFRADMARPFYKRAVRVRPFYGSGQVCSALMTIAKLIRSFPRDQSGALLLPYSSSAAAAQFTTATDAPSSCPFLLSRPGWRRHPILFCKLLFFFARYFVSYLGPLQYWFQRTGVILSCKLAIILVLLFVKAFSLTLFHQSRCLGLWFCLILLLLGYLYSFFFFFFFFAGRLLVLFASQRPESMFFVLCKICQML